MAAPFDDLVPAGTLARALVLGIVAACLVQAVRAARGGLGVVRGIPRTAGRGLQTMLAIVFALVLVYGVIDHFRSPPSTGKSGSPSFELILGSIQAEAFIAAIAVGALVIGGPGLQSCGFPGEEPRQAAVRGVRAIVVAIPLSLAAKALSTWIFGRFGIAPDENPAALILLRDPSALHIAALAASVSLVAPLAEEILFRGLVYASARRWLGRAGGAAAAAAIFAIAHPPGDWLSILVVGITLGETFERTGSLAGPMAGHVVNNAFGVAMILLAR